ncbi:cytochrome P450 [Nonomuraea sp. NPDC049269]|uniref:cytochrome P450 n=1 Tax=Nonomuraea sp. NPDC049269 TaxID=3364349 RepID=UPI003715EAF1
MSQVLAGPADSRTSAPPRSGAIVAVLAFAGIVTASMQTLVIPLVPRLPSLLGASASWAVTATLLAAAIATPVVGRLGDMYGKRRMLLISLTLLAESMAKEGSGGIGFIMMDDPDHARLHRMVTSAFTIKRVEAMRPATQRIADELIGEKLAKPGDDLLSGLVERVKAGELSRPITHGGLRRVALEDIEIAGQVIRAGEGIIIVNETANRDPSVFPDPDLLDLQRNARLHVSFGYGVHQCLGQPLARMELQVAYPALLRRLPTLALATEVEQIPFKHDGFVCGAYELPVTW